MGGTHCRHPVSKRKSRRRSRRPHHRAASSRCTAQAARAGRAASRVALARGSVCWRSASLGSASHARARGNGAPLRYTPVLFNAVLSMPPVWRDPVPRGARPRRRRRGGRSSNNNNIIISVRRERPSSSVRRERPSSSVRPWGGLFGTCLWVAPIVAIRSANGNLDGAAVDLTIVRPAAAAPPRRLEQVEQHRGSLCSRVGLLAERVARLRLARTRAREWRAIKVYAGAV